MKKILVIGALGQIGSELTLALGKKYGYRNVVASDCKPYMRKEFFDKGIQFESFDCLNINTLRRIIERHDVSTIYHLAAILSAKAEGNPNLAWGVNIDGLRNVLNVSRFYKCSVFVPSSIAVFGSSTPRNNTPQDTIQRPGTIYGITKLAGELLCDYYFKKFGVDVRGVRYPGIISSATMPGGGTTDYAVQIFYDAIQKGEHVCYLASWTRMSMMYMPDAIKAAIGVMEADPVKLVHRNAFNISAMSFTPVEIANEIRKHVPDFKINYSVDMLRQEIANSWPEQMDDSVARQEWGWSPDYDLPTMTEDMLTVLKKRLKK